MILENLTSLVEKDADFINRAQVWQPAYAAIWGSQLMCPDLNSYTEMVANILNVILTNGTKEEQHKFFRGIWYDVADGDYYFLALNTASRISEDRQLEHITPYFENIIFLSDLRIFYSNSRFYLKGPGGSFVAPTSFFIKNNTHIEYNDSSINEIIERTNAKSIYTGFNWIWGKLITNDKIKGIENEKIEKKYDVFISHKSQDYDIAKDIYDFLTAQCNYNVFLSEISLPQMGSAEYMKQIDIALEQSIHMILVGSSVKNLTSSWVEAEWRMFINEKRGGRKDGNFLTVIPPEINSSELPMSLRYYEVVNTKNNYLTKLVAYLSKK